MSLILADCRSYLIICGQADTSHVTSERRPRDRIVGGFLLYSYVDHLYMYRLYIHMPQMNGNAVIVVG